MPLRIVTINLLSDLSLWELRRPLLEAQLKELRPDLLAVQEVNLQAGIESWLSGRLNMPHVFLTRKTGRASHEEGIAILSRLPFERREMLDLRTQDRVAQCVQVRADGRPILFANTHLYWRPDDSHERQEQVDLLLNWLEKLQSAVEGEDAAVIVCGDFNATPDTESIRKMKRRLVSAYEDFHGREPAYTAPTPLPRSRLAMLITFFRFLGEIRPSLFNLNWKGTLDYIFVQKDLAVEQCEVVLDRPAPDQPKIYPSDHFGLFARLRVSERQRSDQTGATDHVD